MQEINDCVIVKTVESLDHWEPPAGKRQSCGDHFMCGFFLATVQEQLTKQLCMNS